MFHATAPAPVVGNERLDAPTGLLIDQRNDVLDEMLCSVGGDLLRSARALETAKVGRDASIAVTKVLEHVVPDERTFREAMQEKQDRKRRRTAGPATQGDAMRQDRVERLDHARLLRALGRRRTCVEVIM